MKEFILSSMGGERLKLPVNPASFAEDQGHNNSRFHTELGEIKAIGRRILKEIRLESFFPSRMQSFCTYKDFPSPYECKALIEKWKDSNQPIRLLITETDINHAFTIDRFTTMEKDGTGDVYYSLELSEYRFLNVPVSHNPAPVDAVSGLKKRPNINASAAKQAKKSQQKVAQKAAGQKQKQGASRTAVGLDLFKAMADEMKAKLDKKPRIGPTVEGGRMLELKEITARLRNKGKNQNQGGGSYWSK